MSGTFRPSGAEITKKPRKNRVLAFNKRLPRGAARGRLPGQTLKALDQASPSMAETEKR